ncbi:MAG: class I SAM-dependent methyltransferase [Nocardioides sp.]
MRAAATEHPFAERWNHNTHHFPRLAAAIPAGASRILDVGCGEGTFCRYVASQGRAVVGTDVDPAVLPAAGPGNRYVASSAEQLPFADDSFDAVTMAMVLHHVDPDRSIAEGVRVLTPGGVLQVLGYARFGGARDLLPELRDVVVHRRMSRRTTPWDPPTEKAEAVLTWRETAALLHVLLPGCTYRRLPLWRYLVRWERPRA